MMGILTLDLAADLTADTLSMDIILTITILYRVLLFCFLKFATGLICFSGFVEEKRK